MFQVYVKGSVSDPFAVWCALRFLVFFGSLVCVVCGCVWVRVCFFDARACYGVCFLCVFLNFCACVCGGLPSRVFVLVFCVSVGVCAWVRVLCSGVHSSVRHSVSGQVPFSPLVSALAASTVFGVQISFECSLGLSILVVASDFSFQIFSNFSSPLSSLNFPVFTLQTLFTTLISGLSIFSVFTSSNSFHHSWSSVFQSFWLSQFRGVSGLSLGFGCPLLISFFFFAVLRYVQVIIRLALPSQFCTR